MTEHPTTAPADREDPTSAGLDIEKLNSIVRYAMYSVFSLDRGLLDDDREAVTKDFQQFLDSLEAEGVTVRGVYDVGALSADADVMIWWHAESMAALQAAYRRFLRVTELGQACTPVWSNAGLHRPAEFNRSHLPGFIQGNSPRGWVCVYPFVRSYDWYLLPAEERAVMLRDHGLAARGFDDVVANTVSAFALGDYEWLLAFECDTLERIVELMHKMRYTEARRHVREELPFYTGRRVNGSAEDLAEFIESLA